ncbi:hypothetical protein GCM10022226_24470 [Sphaerisporangium flaviroseum]|uniref:Uncharacterized protein n=1 Tax=Sphaerisporangium flaviroseum TaxID=509199 RepID=A0ABP7HZF5_9ACTN
MTDEDLVPLSFLDLRLPPSFELRGVIVEPGRERVYDETEWRDAIVMVERGRIELVCSDGHRHGFGRGHVLWLHGLPVRVLFNPGREPAVLVAISRRAAEPDGRAAEPDERAAEPDERAAEPGRSAAGPEGTITPEKSVRAAIPIQPSCRHIGEHVTDDVPPSAEEGNDHE